jgi:hypothetical protein
MSFTSEALPTCGEKVVASCLPDRNHREVALECGDVP